jgi:Flp pilus assembly protein TadD
MHERLATAWWQGGNPDQARQVLEAGLMRNPDASLLNELAGNVAYATHDFPVAAKHYKTAAADPQIASRVGSGLIDSLLWMGRTGEARKTAEQLLAMSSGNVETSNALGNQFEDRGMLREAERFYRKAISQRPSSRLASLNLMRILSLQGAYRDAGKTVLALIAHHPHETDLLVQLTRLLRRSGQADATLYRKEALAHAANRLDLMSIIAVGDILEGHVEQGLNLLRAVHKEFPTSEQVGLFLGEVLRHAARGEECISLFDNVSSGELLRTRAACHQALGDKGAALRDLKQSVNNGVEADVALMDGAKVLMHTQTRSQAESTFTDLLQHWSEAVTGRGKSLARATMLDFFGDAQGARSEVQGLVNVWPTDPDLILRLVELETRTGKLTEAIHRLESLTKEYPDNPYFLNALGYTLVDHGMRLREAEVYLRRAYRMAPEEGFIMDSLGWLLFKQKDFTGARRLFEQANRSSPMDSEILMHLGMVYQRLGMQRQAQDIFVQALETKPAFHIQRKLQRLHRGTEARS